MLEYWRTLLYFLPGSVVVLLLVFKALKPSSFWAGTWWAFVLGVTFLSLLFQTVAYALATGPSTLVRDLVAIASLAVAVPICVGGLVALGRRFGWAEKAGAALAATAGLVLVGITPFVVLIVHCTSGDCI